jgi:hypothetical protein
MLVLGASGWCEVQPILGINRVVRYKPTTLITQEKRLNKGNRSDSLNSSLPLGRIVPSGCGASFPPDMNYV